MQKHQDIIKEYEEAVRTGVIPESGVRSGEWTAKALSERLPHLPIRIIYEFMVGLRDNPEEYLGYIAKGAPVL